ncbi:MAG: hypothetical protein HEP71_28665 [Roseivirga sp.]|nr:hypothetical protein [Roseivirga sp.]
MFDRKIRIGLLIQSDQIPSWAYHMLERINASPNTEIALVIKKKADLEGQGESFIQGLISHPKERLFRLFRKLDKRRNNPKPNAFIPRNLWDLIDCPKLEISTKSTKFSDRVLPEDIEKIRAYDLDLLFRSGYNILRGDILTVTRYGIWSYHHGDNKVNRGGPAGTWEVLEGWDENGALLQILTEDLDGGITLSESTIQTNKKSLIGNRNTLYWKASSMLPRKIEELHRLGEKKFFEQVDEQNAAPSFYYNRLYKMPTNAQMRSVFLKNYWERFRRKISKKFYFDQWILLFELKKKENISSSFFRFKRIVPPKDRIWADPFVIERNGKYYIFLEELLLKGKKKAHISVIEMDEKGEYSTPQKVLETDFHLSYPFLIEEGAELYMIPESNDNKTIDLYRCTDFPLKWEYHSNIMNNVVASDSTIFRHNNKYWMFTNIKEVPGATTLDELFLFYSDDLLSGEWTPHPLNPIISDVKFARPAGNIFEHKGRIYRPAQDNSGHYGRAMNLREIVRLDEEEFEEKTVQSVYPNWDKDLLSTHTLNNSGKLTVIDALIKRRR